MSIERIDFGNTAYSGTEAAIHMARYAMVRDLCKGRKVLDIACGEGYGSRLLLDWGASEVVGVDISDGAIANARSNFGTVGLTYICGDAGEAANILANQKFDLIVSFETIEHLQTPSEYLTAITKIANKDTIIVISCPNDWFYFPDPEDGNEHHTRKYYFDEFVEFVSKYLGPPSAIGVGTPCIGWINLPFENNKIWNNAATMKGMMEVRDTKSLVLPAEAKSLTKNNSHYFWSAWGVQKDEMLSHSTLPISGEAYRIIVANDDPVSLQLIVRRWNILTAMPKALLFLVRRIFRRF